MILPKRHTLADHCRGQTEQIESSSTKTRESLTDNQLIEDFPAVVVENVSTRYAKHEILRLIKFTAPAGKVTAIVGPNGSGKTTLLRTITGARSLVKGSIRLFGKDISQLNLKSQAQLRSVVAQQHNSGAGFTARDMVRMGCEAGRGIFDFSRNQDASVISAALEATDTAELAVRNFAELSGGEQQRVLIARAVAQRAPLMILDEPTNHLDLESQMKIMELIRGLVSREGLSVVLTLHDLNLALDYTDRVIVLSDGEVVAEGESAEILAPELIEHTFAVATDRVTHPRTERPHLLFGPLKSQRSMKQKEND